VDDKNHNPNPGPAGGHDDYLWDRSGPADPEIQKLELLLKEFRHDSPAPVFTDIVPEKRESFFSRLRFFPVLAGATAALLILFATIFLLRSAHLHDAHLHNNDNEVGWNISSVAGTARIGTNTVSNDAPGRLGVGETLETAAESHASLNADEVGLIEIDPGTRLRLLTMGEGQHRIALDRGTIHTHIWAPPGQFVVDTPSAVTVDLGCAYTLKVDDSGAGIVRTSLGWVGFKLNGREAFIPAGAACATRPKIGPGTPYFEDAARELREALTRFDFTDSGPQQRSADLAIVIAHARPSDALTVWHLLSRVDADQRVLVYDKLHQLVPSPPGVTKDGILHLDQPMLDQWWNALGFDDISVWRHWEHSWSEAPANTK
jgi:hypothetical protein